MYTIVKEKDFVESTLMYTIVKEKDFVDDSFQPRTELKIKRRGIGNNNNPSKT